MIIKLTPFKHDALTPGQSDSPHDYINVYRTPYSDTIKAYFLRSKIGTALIVNDTLTPAEQAKAISIVKKNIKKCGLTEMGIIYGDWSYACGGHCCNPKKEVQNYEV